MIDPVLTFSTYLSGTASDTIRAITADASGNIYVTGETAATDFPLSYTNAFSYRPVGPAFMVRIANDWCRSGDVAVGAAGDVSRD